MFFAILLMVSAQAQSAPFLERGSKYPVLPEKKEAAESFTPLKSMRLETRIELESFNGNEKEPNVRSNTDQLIRIKSLEPVNKEERTEIEFERYDIFSIIPVPGMSKPFESRQDFGTYLLGKPYVLRWKERKVIGVEGLDKVRARLSEVKDPITKHTLLQVFTEDMVKRSSSTFMPNDPCLETVGKKKPGEKWTVQRQEGNSTLKADCVFDGWAESKGKKLLVLSFTMPKQKQISTQDNGVQHNVESEGRGQIVVEPLSRETLFFSAINLSLEPPPEELRKLEAQKKVIPRTRSKMRTWNHHYPN